ncbi:Tyrosine-protein kinase YwqD [Bradyrhizobium ivorense]|uniref:non-specific protein-tyrosine kinase n=1 Tax=Bradyrhizobium ivorense TaxID=2511166 RepID=A0A508SSG4_9BRAD|nr:polysaccharide biosynthesis tyrosine autokinase [Bradyrhizobium ivorense]VIO65755.1 Tyrosine-protein kinase YwqD [Bradyrhizobium ivorense]VIO71727.1 Tyrosine-protein kinase YwqD [Bradyrhizobium ivorense]
MLQTRITHPREIESPTQESASLEQTVSSAIALIGRQYPVIIFVMCLCIGLAGVYLLTAPKRYTGTAVLLIDSRKMQGLQTQQATGADSSIDSAMVDSQVEVLKSETIATNVIKQLHLLDSPEFTDDEAGLLTSISNLFSWMFPEQRPSEAALMRIAIGKVLGYLSIKRVGLSYVIEISYQSRSPDEAARIANAVAEGYINDSLESKYQASRRAAVWLQDRLKELRTEASTAERAVVDFKAKNNIVDAGGRLLTEQQLAEINSSLTQARAQRAEAQAKLERITAILNSDDGDSKVILNDLATVTDTMNNPVITKLRQTYLDYAARESDWSNRYGPTHLAVVNLRNQMREIRHSITDELRRTAEVYKSDLAIAKAREESSQKSLNDTITLSNGTNQAQIALRDLESNAQSARALSDNFLQLYMVSVQQQSFPITEARVITQASNAPNKTSPKTTLILLATLIGGAILAGGVAVLLDMMDRVFRTVSQVEQYLRTSCLASIPTIGSEQNQGLAGHTLLSRAGRLLARRRKQPQPAAPKSVPAAASGPPLGKSEPRSKQPQPHGDRLLTANQSVGRYVINSPFSRFAEGFRSIKLACDLSSYGSANKVVGITSGLPNEGKSTVSEALAQTVAQSGARTLLIDGDIRNPSLTARLAPSAHAGLIDVVIGRVDWTDAVWIDPQTNLHFMPCVVTSRFSNSSDVLASPQMERLFQNLREHYDRIILDLSPLAPVIDVRATGALADSYILVVEWAKAKVDILERVLSETPIVRERMLGAILNKVNMAVMSRYDIYSAGYYRNRYYKRYGYVD